MTRRFCRTLVGLALFVLAVGAKSGYSKTAQYWRALTAMFMEKFEVALKLFQEYLAQYGEGDEYYADGMFRVAMSYYGMDKIVESSAQLKKFIEKYPEHELTPEALNMMGDILGSEGKLDEAIATYKRAVQVTLFLAQKDNTAPVKMAFVDYATIQQARTLELEGRYEEIVKLMQEYLDRWEEKGNFGEATYWLGTAKTEMKKLDEAYQHFLTSIFRFGNNKELDSETFADQAVIAIENVRLFKELQARNRDLSATSEILQAISRSPTDVQPVFDTIANSAAGLTGATVVSVYEYDGQLVHLRTVSPQTYPRGDEFRSLFPRPLTADFAAGRVILERTVLHVADLLTDPATPPASRRWAEWLGLRSVLWVPLLRDGRPVGVIGVSRTEAGRFSDDHVKLLQTFADQAVIAIENVRLFQEPEARNRDLIEILS